jgi:hypothetical protein
MLLTTTKAFFEGTYWNRPYVPISAWTGGVTVFDEAGSFRDQTNVSMLSV